jgi:hypothetical protein
MLDTSKANDTTLEESAEVKQIREQLVAAACPLPVPGGGSGAAASRFVVPR